MTRTPEIPRSHDELVADNVRISGENVRLRGALGDLVNALRNGAPSEGLIERAEVLLGRRVRE